MNHLFSQMNIYRNRKLISNETYLNTESPVLWKTHLWLEPIHFFLKKTENTAAPSKILALAHTGQNGITVTLNRDTSSYSDVHWYRHGDIAPAITMADTHGAGTQHTAGERQILSYIHIHPLPTDASLWVTPVPQVCELPASTGS